jgi:hypothetical protein
MEIGSSAGKASPGATAAGGGVCGQPLWRWWMAVFVAALLLYGLTSSRGVQWGDSGEFQVRLLKHQLHHRLGLALIHPLHHWLCRLMEMGPWEPADAATLVSVITSAGLIANLVVLLRILCVRMSAALVTAAMLAVAHTVWMHGAIAEVYGLVGLTMTAELAALAMYARTGRSGWLILTALFNGLGVSNHNLCGLVLPIHAGVAAAAVFRRRMSVGQFLLAVVAWLAAASPFLAIIMQEAGRTSWNEAFISAVFGGFGQQVTNMRIHAGTLALGATYIAYNFPNLGLFFAFASLWNRQVPKLFYRVLVIDLLILLFFALRYDVPDQFAFYYPCYPLLAVLAGLGLERLLPDRTEAATARTAGLRGQYWLALAVVGVLATPAVYLGACHFARTRGYLSTQARAKPYRDDWAAFLIPWQHISRHAEQLNEALFRESGASGLILAADSAAEWAMDYFRIREKEYSGVEIIIIEPEGLAEPEVQHTVRDSFARGRPVVLSPRHRDQPPEVIAGSTWRRVGDVYVLEALPE